MAQREAGILRDLKFVGNDVRQEKSKTLAVRVWEIFGFGTQYAWLFSVMFGAVFFSFSGDAEWAKTVKGCFAIGFAIVYLCFFFLKNAIDFGSMGRWSVVFLGAMGTMGTVLVVLPGDGVLGIAVPCVAAILVGTSQAALMAIGNRAWSRMRPERVMVHLAASAFVACVLYYCLSLIPAMLSAVAVCALPAIGGVILSTTKKESLRVQPLRKLDLGERHLCGRILVFVAAFSFPMGIVVGEVSYGALDVFVFEYGVLLSGALIASLLAFVLALRAAPAGMLKILAGAGVPLILVGCICVLAFPEKGFLAGGIFAVAGFVASDLFMWFLNAELVSRSGRSSIEVLARSCCVEWTSFFVGFALSCGFFYGVWDAVGSVALLYAIAAVFLILVTSFVLTQVDLVRIIEARESIQNRQRTEDACKTMAERYGLSARESEVMVYLANGRSVPYIQEKLTISQSTVKTHVRNIYRKMGIDGKQALLDMVEKETF